MPPELPSSTPSARESILLGIDAIRGVHPGVTVDMSNALTMGFNVGIHAPRGEGGIPAQVVIATSLSPAVAGKEKLSLVSVRRGETVDLYHIDSDMAADAMTGQPLEEAMLAELDTLIEESEFSNEKGAAELGRRMMGGKYSNWMHALLDTEFIS
jgi:hypothetical protein